MDLRSGNTVRRIELASPPVLLYAMAATMSGGRPMRAVGGPSLRAILHLVAAAAAATSYKIRAERNRQFCARDTKVSDRALLESRLRPPKHPQWNLGIRARKSEL